MLISLYRWKMAQQGDATSVITLSLCMWVVATVPSTCTDIHIPARELAIADMLKDQDIRHESYNVGCMYWDYEPVTLDEILAAGKEKQPTILAARRNIDENRALFERIVDLQDEYSDLITDTGDEDHGD